MHPFRFGLVWTGERSPVELARHAEDTGYATLLFPDHTGMLAPLPAMGAAAAVTSRLRLGTQMINIAFRPLAMLAQEAAAIDVISEGRLELGLGAGYAAEESASMGMDFPHAPVRIRHVGRALRVLPRLFAGEEVTEEPGYEQLHGYKLDPLPPQGAAVPLAAGGNGPRMLDTAARLATIVQFTGFTAPPDPHGDFGDFNEDGLGRKVAFVRERAGERFAALELSVLVQRAGVVSGRPEAEERVRAATQGRMSAEQAATNPFLMFGSAGQLCERLLMLRERYGVSYFTVFAGRSAGFDEVVTRLAGE